MRNETAFYFSYNFPYIQFFLVCYDYPYSLWFLFYAPDQIHCWLPLSHLAIWFLLVFVIMNGIWHRWNVRRVFARWHGFERSNFQWFCCIDPAEFEWWRSGFCWVWEHRSIAAYWHRPANSEKPTRKCLTVERSAWHSVCGS